MENSNPSISKISLIIYKKKTLKPIKTKRSNKYKITNKIANIINRIVANMGPGKIYFLNLSYTP
jgi:hypothetical protein